MKESNREESGYTNGKPEPQQQETEESYTPSSPARRIIAWTGIAYMVLIILLNLYPFFHKGEYLYGVFPLMVCPAAVGLFILAICQLKAGAEAARKVAMILLAVGCVVLFVMGLKDGLPALLAAMGGAQ